MGEVAVGVLGEAARERAGEPHHQRPDVTEGDLLRQAAVVVGGSVGTAVVNSVAVAATASYAASHVGAAAHDSALVHGIAAATAWSAVVLAATAVVAFVLVRTPRPGHHVTEEGASA